MMLQMIDKPIPRSARYDSVFRYYAGLHGLDWRWMKAQAIAESGLDPEAISRAGAKGLTQFMGATWRWIMGKGDPFDAEESIDAQSRYMRYLLGRMDGDLFKAFAAYNWGEGNVRRAGKDWRERLPRETRDYLTRIRRVHDKLHREAMEA